MSAKFEACSPGEIRYRLTIDLTLSQWVRIKGALEADENSRDDSRVLRSSVTDMVRQAEKLFYPSVQTMGDMS